MTAPANDDFANAQLVNPGGSVFGPFVIDDATRETGEGTGPAQTVWYKFFAGEATTVTVSTWGSSAGDADSGDLEPAGGPFGYLDTRIAAYSSTDPSPSFGALTGVTNNDDHPDTGEPHTGDGFYWSYMSFTTVPGSWYWIQAGTFGTPYTGTLRVEFTGVSRLPFSVVDVGDCPEMVNWESVGPASTSSGFAHTGDYGTYVDGQMDWYEPTHDPGDLLVFALLNNKNDLATPPGYTEVFNDLWDNAPITPPIHGANSTDDGPAETQQVQFILAYRIADDTWTTENTIVGSYSGFKYTDGGLGYGNNWGSARVYRFTVQQMGGDYETTNNWPVNPVKVSSLDSADYQIDLGNGDGTSGGWYGAGGLDPHPRHVDVPDITADYPGNHIWMSWVLWHGPSEGTWRTFDPDPRRTTMDLLDQFIMKHDTFDEGSLNAGSGYGGGGTNSDFNFLSGFPFLSNKNYFLPFIPESWVPDTFGPSNDTWDSENGFVDSSPARAYPLDSHSAADWQDGFVGVAGTDFYVWELTGGIASIQLLIQGPEVSRPSNDLIANAYTVPECPVTIAECVFGQTADGDADWDGLGDPDTNAGVWFRYVPASDETGVVISTDVESSDPSLGDVPSYTSEYDTILIVYDSSMTVLESDDDSGLGDLSTITMDVTGGETYYIQVAGYGGDEGRLLLTIDCEGGVETLAADIWGWGGDTGEGWHITLGTDA
jgi:hypothetical protein